MKPSKEIIENFQKIYFEEFGEEITKEESYEKFLRLVNLLRVVLKEPSPNARNNISAARLFDDDFINDKLKE
jgi:hypothetical protein